MQTTSIRYGCTTHIVTVPAEILTRRGRPCAWSLAGRRLPATTAKSSGSIIAYPRDVPSENGILFCKYRFSISSLNNLRPKWFSMLYNR